MSRALECSVVTGSINVLENGGIEPSAEGSIPWFSQLRILREESYPVYQSGTDIEIQRHLRLRPTSPCCSGNIQNRQAAPFFNTLTTSHGIICSTCNLQTSQLHGTAAKSNSTITNLFRLHRYKPHCHQGSLPEVAILY